MFTGIIEQTGTLVSLTDRGGVRRITVEAPGIASRLREGRLARRLRRLPDRARSRPHATFTPIWRRRRWTAPRSARSLPAPRSISELPTAAGSPLGGHIVQGHVDGTGAMTALDPVIPESSPQLRHADHRLDAQGPRSGKCAPMDGAQRLGGRRGHQPDHCRFRRRGDHHCDSAADLLADEPAHARVGAPVNVEADVLVKLAATQMQAAKEARVGVDRGLAGGERILKAVHSS